MNPNFYDEDETEDFDEDANQRNFERTIAEFNNSISRYGVPSQVAPPRATAVQAQPAPEEKKRGTRPGVPIEDLYRFNSPVPPDSKELERKARHDYADNELKKKRSRPKRVISLERKQKQQKERKQKEQKHKPIRTDSASAEIENKWFRQVQARRFKQIAKKKKLSRPQSAENTKKPVKKARRKGSQDDRKRNQNPPLPPQKQKVIRLAIQELAKPQKRKKRRTSETLTKKKKKSPNERKKTLSGKKAPARPEQKVEQNIPPAQTEPNGDLAFDDFVLPDRDEPAFGGDFSILDQDWDFKIPVREQEWDFKIPVRQDGDHLDHKHGGGERKRREHKHTPPPGDHLDHKHGGGERKRRERKHPPPPGDHLDHKHGGGERKRRERKHPPPPGDHLDHKHGGGERKRREHKHTPPGPLSPDVNIFADFYTRQRERMGEFKSRPGILEIERLQEQYGTLSDGIFSHPSVGILYNRLLRQNEMLPFDCNAYLEEYLNGIVTNLLTEHFENMYVTYPEGKEIHKIYMYSPIKQDLISLKFRLDFVFCLIRMYNTAGQTPDSLYTRYFTDIFDLPAPRRGPRAGPWTTSDAKLEEKKRFKILGLSWTRTRHVRAIMVYEWVRNFLTPQIQRGNQDELVPIPDEKHRFSTENGKKKRKWVERVRRVALMDLAIVRHFFQDPANPNAFEHLWVQFRAFRSLRKKELIRFLLGSPLLNCNFSAVWVR